MTMQQAKIYRARFRGFSVYLPPPFARQPPETPSVVFSGADNRCYGKYGQGLIKYYPVYDVGLTAKSTRN